MLRHERRLLIDSLFIGAALTLLVVAVDATGLLAPVEDFLYDQRARHCQFFSPPPSDKLVHLDIDDAALRDDLEQDQPTVETALKQHGFNLGDKGMGDRFFLARRDAIAQRLAAMKATPQMTFEQIRAKLLPRTPLDVHPGVENVVR